MPGQVAGPFTMGRWSFQLADSMQGAPRPPDVDDVHLAASTDRPRCLGAPVRSPYRAPKPPKHEYPLIVNLSAAVDLDAEVVELSQLLARAFGHRSDAPPATRFEAPDDRILDVRGCPVDD